MWNECKCAPTWSPCCRRQPSSRVSAKQQDRSDNIRLGMVGCIFQQKQQRSLFKAGIDINEHAWRWLKLWTSKTISWLIKTYIVLFSEEAKFIHTSSKGVRARLDFKMHSEVRTWRKSCLKKNALPDDRRIFRAGSALLSFSDILCSSPWRRNCLTSCHVLCLSYHVISVSVRHPNFCHSELGSKHLLPLPLFIVASHLFAGSLILPLWASRTGTIVMYCGQVVFVDCFKTHESLSPRCSMAAQHGWSRNSNGRRQELLWNAKDNHFSELTQQKHCEASCT